MRALVTGSAGFIGSHLTERLLADGWEVLGVDCFNDNYGREQKRRNLESALSWDAFTFYPVDLSGGDLEDLVAGVDTVFHLAAEPGVRSSWGKRFEYYTRNNVIATQRVFEAVREYGSCRVVYASSSSIYGDAETLPTPETAVPAPRSPYGVTKLAAEHLCDVYHHNFGVETVSLRYFSVYGPRQRPDMFFHRLIKAMLADDTIEVFGDGEQTRDFTFVDDVVSATLAAASAPDIAGRVYNIGDGGACVSVNQALAAVEEIFGREARVRHCATESGDVRDTGALTTRAARDLGFTPQTKIRDGLALEAAWLNEFAGTPTDAYVAPLGATKSVN
ncbi:MAG: NAD-dependent epimerase/dehydratase family protein [Solirubrobacterales bacterium]